MTGEESRREMAKAPLRSSMMAMRLKSIQGG
jgi:hypothetical protein